jgi:uncharacterized protein (DUF983 family)
MDTSVKGEELYTPAVVRTGEPVVSRLDAATIRRALSWGWRRRCPHCGEGPLFAGRARHLDACSQCGLVFERNPGDTWAFTIIGDRIPIAAIIVVIYFGIGRAHPAIGFGLIALFGALIVWTAPNRWGVGIALHYLSRVIWPEADDPIPRTDKGC